MSASEWGLLGLLVLLALCFCFGLGWTLVDAYTFIAYRYDRVASRRWGLERQIFPVDRFWVILIWILFFGVSALFFAYVFLIAVGIFVEDGNGVEVREESFMFSVFVLISMFLAGVYLKAYRVNRYILKIRTLQRLPPYFHYRLSISEIVGIYDGLVRAPAVVWEEFAGLTNFQLSRGAGKTYRELASLYLSMDSLRLAKIGVLLATATVIIALTALATQVQADFPFEFPFLSSDDPNNGPKD